MGRKRAAPNRRQVMQGGAAAAGVLATGSARAAGARAPNILFIMADDMGYADLSCYGRRDYQTPALDRLAREGLLLTQGYANSAVCSATRTALITGRYQYRLRAGLEEPIPTANTVLGLSPDHPTLPSLLKALGYRTALFGKWHLGALPQHGPLKSGYDHFFGFYPGANDYFRRPGITPSKGEVAAPLYEDEQVVQPRGYLTDLLAERASAWISETARDRPFFVSLHFNAPHWPWEGPEDEAVSRTLTSLRHLDGGDIATYAAMVRSLDAAVGRVLAALRAHGVERDTLVVFTSDNGGERFADTWPFNGRKGELLEGGLRVPLIVRWPARIRAGQRSSQVMTSMDFLPTLLAAAGGAPDPRYPSDGEDLLPVLTGRAPPHPRTLYWRYKAAEQAALREGDLKYLLIGGREYLFDVARDPQERADLKGLRPDDFARLKAMWRAWDSTMLPYPAESYSDSLKPFLADRY